MLITLLSYFDSVPDNEDYCGESPTGSIVRETMSTSDDNFVTTREEDRWEKISIPISIEEDYEIVISPSDFPVRDDALASTATTDDGRTKRDVSRRMKTWQNQRSFQRDQLGPSISKTFAELSRKNPNKMEKEAIQRAMELSMLDVALVQSQTHHFQNKQQQRPPHKILGVTENAGAAEIKTAYRRLARLHHPDRGGQSNRFEEIARAYRSLLSSAASQSSTLVQSHIMDADGQATSCLTTATCEKGLQDHRRLVNDLFQADGMDLKICLTKQLRALDILGLTFRDAGAINRNERNEIIHNSCFYLSLATSYLWGIGAFSFRDNEGWRKGANEKEEDELLVGETALLLKRTIEAAVVKAHPEWVLQGKIGEEVQAFSDFLVYTLDSHTLLSDWAIAVFDTTSGFCDIFKGRNFENQKALMQSNTITLRYVPGHYQALVPSSSLARRPTLNEITTTLDDLELFYVVTDGKS
eukprot:CAMPEP_0197174288 /NCGR_PEP_ID=MMETSP1423-20130617/874_1 /TAXON_ID=476441 /ORGANISM="Pseudo-nitzschia heimii, Strain UNC1101" /LENGTH=469 /DNA_ID=CAMNT_0042623199 /DNA_START=262 /DNA_END=1671 /DNA_ORIENTATION=+